MVPTRFWSAWKRQLINLVMEGQLQPWQLPYFTINLLLGVACWHLTGSLSLVRIVRLHEAKYSGNTSLDKTTTNPPSHSLSLKPCWLGLLIQRDCLVSNFNDIPAAYHPRLPGDRIWARPLIRFPHIRALKSNFFSSSFWCRLLWNPSPCCVSMGGQNAGRMGQEVKGRPVGCWSHIKAWKQRPREPSLQTQIRRSESKCASLRSLRVQTSTQEKALQQTLL